MGTEAQQALQPRQRAIRPRNRNNEAATRQAKGRAARESAKPGHIAKRKQQREQPRGDQYGREIGDGVAGSGGFAQDTAMKKAEGRASPKELVSEVVGAMSGPKNYRPPGSIWDDPTYGPMANERGADFAMRARNLDRQYNQAKQWQQSRVEGMQNQLAIDEGKLRDKEIQHAMRQYAPGQQQAVGTQNVTGVEREVPGSLAVDASGAFTGEGKQAGMVGPGPQQQAPAPDMKSQAQLIESYAAILQDRRMDESVKDLVREELRKTLSGGQTNTSQSPWPEYPDAFEENGQWFVERDGKRFRLEFEE